jgi:oligopeptide/dipeptide ABC transporter ATP-binding protein
LRSVPDLADLDRPIRPIRGQMSDPMRPPSGCRFMPRCEIAIEACGAPVDLRVKSPGHEVRCVRMEPDHAGP